MHDERRGFQGRRLPDQGEGVHPLHGRRLQAQGPPAGAPHGRGRLGSLRGRRLQGRVQAAHSKPGGGDHSVHRRGVAQAPRQGRAPSRPGHLGQGA